MVLKQRFIHGKILHFPLKTILFTIDWLILNVSLLKTINTGIGRSIYVLTFWRCVAVKKYFWLKSSLNYSICI